MNVPFIIFCQIFPLLKVLHYTVYEEGALCYTHAHVILACRFVKQDQVVVARLETAGVICLETFQDFPRMARFILRDEGNIEVTFYWHINKYLFYIGKTIAIGKVLKLM